MNRGDLARRRRSALARAFCFAAPWGAATSGAANAPGTDPASPLASRAFFRPELSIRATLVRQEASTGAPGGEVWEAFRARYGDEVQVFVDSWSGTPATIVARIPLIPGDGQGNRVALADLGRRLGREVPQVDERAVSDAFLSFVRQNQAAFGLDLGQLGAARAAEARPGLWQVHVPQVYQGIPVRHGRLAATISGGNLVLSGTETWSNVKLDIRPRVTAEDALAAGFAHAGGRAVEDEVVAKPALAVVPFASQSEDGAPAYGHRLVWAFTFQRPPQMEVWEVLTDAHSGEVIAFEDTNHPVRRPMTGNAYPVTSTEQCTSATLCGVMRNVPMPFADTGLAFPNHLTNSAGLFTDTLGAVTTTLSGRFVNINDNCGPTTRAAASGALSLGGATGEHDCETPSGASAGNTASARGVFYELNKWAEVARGWLPTLPFLQNTLAGQREHRPDLQRLLELGHPERELLPQRRRLPQQRRAGGGDLPRGGPRPGRQRRQRLPEQQQRGLRRHRRHLPPGLLLRGLRLLRDRQPGLRGRPRTERASTPTSARPAAARTAT